MSDADVSDADVSDADVSDADVSDADISDADVSDADVSDGGGPLGPGGILGLPHDSIPHRILLVMSGRSETATTTVKEIFFDPSTNAVTEGAVHTMTTLGQVTDIAVLPGQRLALARGTTVASVDQLATVGAFVEGSTFELTHGADPSKSIVAPHASCALPNGNLIVSSISQDPGFLNEYAPSGELMRGVDMRMDPAQRRAYSVCVARSDTELLANWAQTDGGNALILRFTRADSSSEWTVAEELDIHVLLSALGETASRVFVFVVDDENEAIWLLPARPARGGLDRAIRCPSRGFSTATCALEGNPLPLSTEASVYGGAHIPGTEDFLFATYGPSGPLQGLYRFRRASGTILEVQNIAELDLGGASVQAPTSKLYLD